MSLWLGRSSGVEHLTSVWKALSQSHSYGCVGVGQGQSGVAVDPSLPISQCFPSEIALRVFCRALKFLKGRLHPGCVNQNLWGGWESGIDSLLSSPVH